MTVYTSESLYGIGHEETASGTLAAALIGVPQEGLIDFQEGSTFEEVEQYRGVAGMHHDSVYDSRLAPMADGLSHNWQAEILAMLLTAMHQTPGTEATNVFTLVCPTGGVEAEFGSADYTLSAQHKIDSALAKQIKGCVPKQIKITFPGGGGLVKLEYDLAGMASDPDQSSPSASAISSDADLVDLLAGDFTFEFGTLGSPSAIKPEGDVVVTLSPQLKPLYRGYNYPRQFVFDKWGGTVEFTLPADSDAEAMHALFEAKTRREFMFTNCAETEAAAGDFTMHLRGTMLQQPGYEDQGIIGEKVTMQITQDGDGTGTGAAYSAIYYDLGITW